MGPRLAAVLSSVRHFQINTIFCDDTHPEDDPPKYAEKLAALSIEHCRRYESHRETKLRRIVIDATGTGDWLEFYRIQIRRNLPPIVAKISDLELEAESELGGRNMDLFDIYSRYEI
jgi:hypothetical protein